MYRWLIPLLLVLNLGVLIWGWRIDRPGSLPPLPEAPAEIRLLSELPPSVQASAASTETPQVPAADIQSNPPDATPVMPVSAYDRGAVQPGISQRLPETTTERVDPGLMPDELLVEPPVVIPPVREDDEGVIHTWSR